MILREEILPSAAAALTVLSVDMGIKSVLRYLSTSEVLSEYMYCSTYPPNSNGDVDSEVGAEPL